jgi:hypothetical protein
MGMVKLVVTGVKQTVKYAPVIVPAIERARGPATDYAKARLDAARQRRLAVLEAASLKNGTVLELLHREKPVWVVYSGDRPVTAHPEVGVSLDELVQHADLDRRRRPEDFPTARERAASVRHAAVRKVRRKKPPSSVVHPDAQLVGEGVGEVEKLDPADGRAAQAGQAERSDEPRA